MRLPSTHPFYYEDPFVQRRLLLIMDDPDPDPGPDPDPDPDPNPNPDPDPKPNPDPDPDPNPDPKPTDFSQMFGGLSDEDAAFVKNKNWKDASAMIGSVRELEGMVGRNTVIIPDENASEAEVNDFHTKMGRPESQDAYESGFPTDHQATPLDNTLEGSLRGTAFEAGVTQKQWAALTGKWAEMSAEAASNPDSDLGKAMQETRNQAAAQSAAKGVKEFGKEAWAEMTEKGKRFITAYGGEGLLAEMELNGSGISHGMVKMLSTAYDATAEDGVLPNAGGGGDMTAEDAQAELERLEADPKFQELMKDKSHKDYKPARAKWLRLVNAAG